LNIICQSGPASQTLQEAAKVGRSHVYDEHIKDNEDDDVEEDILTTDEKAFCDYIEREWENVDEEYEDSSAYTSFLYEEYKRAFWNHLHTIIFGADAYRAFKQQKDYLMHQVVKPYGTSVKVNFRRIEVIANLMQFFPPPSSRGKPATAEQWDDFQDSKKLPSSIKREMKYNLLPDSFHDRFDELESDWTEMSNSKFLAEAQKCEAADIKERNKRLQASKEKKRKKPSSADTNDDRSVNLNRKQRNKKRIIRSRRQEVDLQHKTQLEFVNSANWPVPLRWSGHPITPTNAKSEIAMQNL
jgi:hypothetical protein